MIQLEHVVFNVNNLLRCLNELGVVLGDEAAVHTYIQHHITTTHRLPHPSSNENKQTQFKNGPTGVTQFVEKRK